MEGKSIASKEYQLWWEVNQEKILAQDKLDHEMNYKSALAKNLKKVNQFINQLQQDYERL